MAELEIVSIREARSMIGKKVVDDQKNKIMEEYVGHIRRLRAGFAGKLSATEGESALAIRRRLRAAANDRNVKLVIERSDDDVYFWKEPQKRGPRKPKVEQE